MLGVGANMFFTVDPSNGVPIYSQIVRQVKFAVAERTLRPGQLLPSVRQLSQQLAVNPNTVARAFQELQSEGVIETLRGRGVVVCKGAVERCRKQRQSILAERLSAVLTEALQAGLSPEEVRKLVDKQLRSLEGTIEAIAELQ
ncbi:transcriptional regulator, GntR family [Rhodopirellula sallentina SM41]|uniref:Transcriptional regulator, GntR family n=2 Tax=Rhodopirellula TaxID=265488 RepID=M5TVG7_9BACT|nr:transcriptional regulator, GntR family [Rhodopirellula sallentina SM41]